MENTLPTAIEFIVSLKNANIGLIQLLQDFAKLHLEAQAKEIAEKAKLKSTSCGDPMTCGCMGNCEYPVKSIDKSSIEKASQNYIQQNLK